jgi:galactose mutarotase-like enzyme
MQRSITIETNNLGAELKSIYLKSNNDGEIHTRECLHQSNEIWKSQSPILFPTIGTSFENHILVDGKRYQQGHHGFTRNLKFENSLNLKERKAFNLISNEETKKFYPFEFSMNVEYILLDTMLTVSYIIKNTDNKPIYFNIGGHPGLNLLENTSIEDYHIEFQKNEYSTSILSSHKGIFEGNKIRLNENLFKESAIILQNLNSTVLKVMRGTVPIIGFVFSSPFLGIWTRIDKEKPFICIEPWYGLPDKTYSGELSKRPNVICLEKYKQKDFIYNIVFYN